MVKKTKTSEKSHLSSEKSQALARAHALDKQLESGGDSLSFGVDTSEPEQELGQRLQFSREAKGLTQGQLSDLTKRADKDGKGVSRAVISLYEANTCSFASRIDPIQLIHSPLSRKGGNPIVGSLKA
ncbi:helix-turn-helix domain-containing protein [Collimonas humicola]|uniref:helix-turn-helix domain-containing protein n=1 Tax=Collimonas humicola TaxID=2825886 RepID=UPI001B8D5D76|nr:helix-turn-helix transcriptional regulator [Collimonas humicola]